MKNILGLILAFVLSSVLLPSLRAADNTDYGTLWGSVEIPDGVAKDQVKKAILVVAADRGWTIRDKSSDGKVVLHLESGKWISTAVLIYDKSEVKIYHTSTKNGKPKVPDWLGNLKKDITKNLNTIAVGGS